MTDEEKPCGYCGYLPRTYGRHASSCPTYEIADLEQRLAKAEELLKSAVQSAKDSMLNFRRCETKRAEQDQLVRDLEEALRLKGVEIVDAVENREPA